MGDFPPGQKGYDAERRYGLPRDGEERDAYVVDWAFRPVDPNMPHLLVVTFYEAKVDKDLVDFQIDDGVGSLVFSLPKRRLQQVICRMFVHPSGNRFLAIGSCLGRVAVTDKYSRDRHRRLRASLTGGFDFITGLAWGADKKHCQCSFQCSA